MAKDDDGKSEPRVQRFERLTPAQVTPGHHSQPSMSQGARKSLPGTVVWLALACLLLVAAGLFLWLVQQSVTPPPDAKAPTSESARVVDAPAPDADTVLAQ